MTKCSTGLSFGVPFLAKTQGDGKDGMSLCILKALLSERLQSVKEAFRMRGIPATDSPQHPLLSSNAHDGMQAGCAHQVVDSNLIDLVLRKEDVCDVLICVRCVTLDGQGLVHFRIADCIIKHLYSCFRNYISSRSRSHFV